MKNLATAISKEFGLDLKEISEIKTVLSTENPVDFIKIKEFTQKHYDSLAINIDNLGIGKGELFIYFTAQHAEPRQIIFGSIRLVKEMPSRYVLAIEEC
ncbi:MAG: hypothetical protein PHR00_01640 [Patescibacteria group bacterium]|nr:hypothetical protein [Patescibacteria group bacterium]